MQIINYKHGRSYVDSPDWIKNKKTVNSINKENNDLNNDSMTQINDFNMLQHSMRIKKKF